MGGVAADRDDAAPGHDLAAAYGAPLGTAADRGIRRSPNGAGDLGVAGRPEPDQPQHACAKHGRLDWRAQVGRCWPAGPASPPASPAPELYYHGYRR